MTLNSTRRLSIGVLVGLAGMWSMHLVTAQSKPAAPASGPAAAPASQPEKKPNTAIIPVSRADSEGWMKRHQSFNDRAAKGDIDLLFLGDSITQGWEGDGAKDVWTKHYGSRNAANFGIGGDRTQHVLWRLQNGNLAGLDKHQPKLIVLMIGTNNSNGEDNTAAEIAEGITTIVKTLREKLPKSKVLLLSIFPRGEAPNPQREKNAKVSEIAAKIADGKNVISLDIGKDFLGKDGSLSKDIMPDFLHLSPRGYEIWAEAIEPTVKQLMAEGKP